MNESIQAEVIHRMKQELNQLGVMYRMDSATKEHHEVFQRLLSRLDGTGAVGTPDAPRNQFTVTVSKNSPPDIDSFAVYADRMDVDEKLRMLNFKSQDVTVVKIAKELVERCLGP